MAMEKKTWKSYNFTAICPEEVGKIHGYVRLRKVSGLQLLNNFGWTDDFLLILNQQQDEAEEEPEGEHEDEPDGEATSRNGQFETTEEWWQRKVCRNPHTKHVTILVVTTPGKGANPSDKCVFLSFLGSWFGIVSNTFLSWHSKFCLETTNFHVESDEHWPFGMIFMLSFP